MRALLLMIFSLLIVTFIGCVHVDETALMDDHQFSGKVKTIHFVGVYPDTTYNVSLILNYYDNGKLSEIKQVGAEDNFVFEIEYVNDTLINTLFYYDTDTSVSSISRVIHYGTQLIAYEVYREQSGSYSSLIDMVFIQEQLSEVSLCAVPTTFPWSNVIYESEFEYSNGNCIQYSYYGIGAQGVPLNLSGIVNVEYTSFNYSNIIPNNILYEKCYLLDFGPLLMKDVYPSFDNVYFLNLLDVHIIPPNNNLVSSLNNVLIEEDIRIDYSFDSEMNVISANYSSTGYDNSQIVLFEYY